MEGAFPRRIRHPGIALGKKIFSEWVGNMKFSPEIPIKQLSILLKKVAHPGKTNQVRKSLF
jgi:hypothetical protein